MTPLIKPDELASLTDNLVLIDARAGAGAKEKYRTSHLAGARFADLETDLSGPKDNPADGGRHPLPGPEQFAPVLGRLGITPQSRVVVYDEKDGSNAASRFWWMLRAIGHQSVQVLNGGMNAAVAAGYPVQSGEEPPVATTTYPVEGWKLPTVTIMQVEDVAQQPDFLVIDVRDARRYRGEVEPIDLIAGHIPGAVNIPFAGNLDEQGFFRSPEELKAKYEEVLQGRPLQNVIVHCGSGVTACHTLLAMDYAGLGLPVLYVGSWSEWSRTERPIGTGTGNV